MAEKDQDFLEFVVKGLVEHPEDVKIGRTVDEMGVLLTLDLHSDDMGKVIGRSGNTAKAIRTLLRVVGMKHNARVNLKINEPAGSSRPTSWDSRAAEASNEPSPAMKSVDEAMDDLRL
ncbi:MAG: KH domain-containing protein [Patescibacteria group bacterium]|nr:KH domain-containing protein [Patescibacteria group bacterium]